ncbi:UPF0496 protein At1g20180-like [Rhodamnia argentea]|uniref:UPF0496 protein At1g20180-like n=1 Tax=Rhodamnia argentea TaxID=178133 RepID=A0A8B8NX77_9MYRT|nr:UPF0496 protein At1g20180-like [Rhodamnia argentea]
MKLVFLKFRSSFPTTGESRKERLNNMSSKSSIVNREYTQAFRTRSYVEMCTKVQSQLGRISINRSLSSPSLSDTHLSESLLEPGRETLANMIKTLNIHHLLVDYFLVSSDACDVCELLLRAIHQTHANYQSIGRAIELAEIVSEDASHKEEQNRLICRELSLFASLTNPLSAITWVQFQGMHDRCMALFHELKSKHKKMRRRMKMFKACKRVGGLGLIIFSSTITAAALVVAIHSTVGILAVLGLVASCCARTCDRKGKSIRSSSYPEKSSPTGVCASLDIAAKGMYVLINDMDTVSRLAGRLHDEVEHGRWRAGMAARNCTRMGEIMWEVLKEFHAHTACFLEQLKELEEHIYFCLVTMNRSRRLVVEEILISQSMS